MIAPVTLHHRNRDWVAAELLGDIRNFHRTLPGYAPTPLVSLPEVARELGVAHVFAKDESQRLGLPAFKALGASWAVHRAVKSLPAGDTVTIVTATDGNHGRAIARFARLAGQRAAIWVPRGVHPDAIQAIVDEGAHVTVLDAPYDEAVAAAAHAAEQPGHILIQDTAWEGYEEIPQWIVDGYDTLFAEIDEQLQAAGVGSPSLVAVPTGVGSLLQAALVHYRSAGRGESTAVISVEPEAASCMAPSLAAGHPVSVQTGQTIMSGLNCGTPSSLAWPATVNGLDAAVSITEDADIRAAHDLARMGVAAGPCGASGLAGVRVALGGDESDAKFDAHRHHLGIDEHSTIVFVVTEGVDANPLPV